MGHYSSEMYDGNHSPAAVTADEREFIEDFYAPEKPGTGRPCPRCGASVDWNWVNAQYILQHIMWHYKLVASINLGTALPEARI